MHEMSKFYFHGKIRKMFQCCLNFYAACRVLKVDEPSGSL